MTKSLFSKLTLNKVVSCQDNGYPLIKPTPLEELPIYYPDGKDYITFLFALLDGSTQTQYAFVSRGKPKIYSDVSLLVFYGVMILKEINRIRAQHRWLQTHPLMLATFRLESCPFTMVMNVQGELSTRNATHIKTVFQ